MYGDKSKKVKSEGFVFNSFLVVLCPKKYFFLFILNITLVVLLLYVHVSNKFVI